MATTTETSDHSGSQIGAMVSHTSPRVPNEICDDIINFLGPPSPTTSYYSPDDDEAQRLRALLVCNTVCRAWRPRARVHLYSIAWIGSFQALLSLICTLQSEAGPFLISLVTRFVVAPRVWQSLDLPVHGYLPLKKFFDLNCPIFQFVMCNTMWQAEAYPVLPLYHAKLVSRSRRITHLQLSGVIFPTLRTLFELIHSFHHLVHLSIIGIQFNTPPTDQLIAAMHAHPNHQQSWAAPSLRTLEVGGPGEGIIPGAAVRLLGALIESFRLNLYVAHPIDPILLVHRGCVPDYQNLKTLHVSLHPWTSLKSPSPGSIGEGAQVWKPIHDYFLDLLRTVRSPTVHTISVLLSYQQEDPAPLPDHAPDPWEFPCRYRYTRHGVLDAVFATDTADILASNAFETLTSVELIVHDNSPKHDESWWKLALETRIPGLRPGAIRTKVISSKSDTLWDSHSAGQPTIGDTSEGLGVQVC